MTICYVHREMIYISVQWKIGPVRAHTHTHTLYAPWSDIPFVPVSYNIIVYKQNKIRNGAWALPCGVCISITLCDTVPIKNKQIPISCGENIPSFSVVYHYCFNVCSTLHYCILDLASFSSSFEYEVCSVCSLLFM